MDKLSKLPEMCAAWNLETGDAMLIRRGIEGYYPAPGLDVEAFNARHGITPAQLEAMEIGSMFGWNVPGADPDMWEKPRD